MFLWLKYCSATSTSVTWNFALTPTIRTYSALMPLTTLCLKVDPCYTLKLVQQIWHNINNFWKDNYQRVSSVCVTWYLIKWGYQLWSSWMIWTSDEQWRLLLQQITVLFGDREAQLWQWTRSMMSWFSTSILLKGCKLFSTFHGHSWTFSSNTMFFSNALTSAQQ